MTTRMKQIAVLLLAVLSSGCASTQESPAGWSPAGGMSMVEARARAACELKGYREASVKEVNSMVARAARSERQLAMLKRNAQEYAEAYKRSGGKASKELREIEAAGDRLIQAYVADDAGDQMMDEAGKLAQDGRDFRNCMLIELGEAMERNRTNNIRCTSRYLGGMSTLNCY